MFTGPVSDLRRYIPRPRSRIHGPRKVLGELQRLHTKTGRALEHRQLTDDERTWAGKVYDAIEALVREGYLVLPGSPDPRPSKTVRKKKS